MNIIDGDPDHRPGLGFPAIDTSVVDTLFRELGEELGITRDDLGHVFFLGMLEHAWQEDQQMHQQLNILFLCPYDRSHFDSTKVEDKLLAEWIGLKNLAAVNLLPAALCDILPLWVAQAEQGAIAPNFYSTIRPELNQDQRAV